MRPSVKISQTSLPFDVFLTFLGQPRAKHILFRPFSAESLPRMLSKPIIPLGTSLKKSKKRQAIASGARARAQAQALAQAHKGAQIPQRQPKGPPKTREPCFKKEGASFFRKQKPRRELRTLKPCFKNPGASFSRKQKPRRELRTLKPCFRKSRASFSRKQKPRREPRTLKPCF